MLIIDNKLKQREQSNKPIKIDVIGAGVRGTGIINQINLKKDQALIFSDVEVTEDNFVISLFNEQRR